MRALANLHKGTFRDRVLIYGNDTRVNPQAPSQSLTIFGYVTIDNFTPGLDTGSLPPVAGAGNSAIGNGAKGGVAPPVAPVPPAQGSEHK